MKVYQYIKLKAIPENTPQPEKDILKMSILFKKPMDYFEGMSFNKLQSCRHMLAIMEADIDKNNTKLRPVIWIRGTRYKAITRPEDFNTSAYLALQLYRKDVTSNLAKILAWIYRPTFGKHDPDKAEKHFESANIKHVSGTFFLFSKKCSKWKAVIPVYNEILLQKLEKHLTEEVLMN